MQLGIPRHLFHPHRQLALQFLPLLLFLFISADRISALVKWIWSRWLSWSTTKLWSVQKGLQVLLPRKCLSRRLVLSIQNLHFQFGYPSLPARQEDAGILREHSAFDYWQETRQWTKMCPYAKTSLMMPSIS